MSKQNFPSLHMLAVCMQGEGESFLSLRLAALCMVLLRRLKIFLGQWISGTTTLTWYCVRSRTVNLKKTFSVVVRLYSTYYKEFFTPLTIRQKKLQRSTQSPMSTTASKQGQNWTSGKKVFKTCVSFEVISPHGIIMCGAAWQVCFQSTFQ